MSTHNIHVCLYGELMKTFLQLSSNTHLICSTTCNKCMGFKGEIPDYQKIETCTKFYRVQHAQNSFNRLSTHLNTILLGFGT